MSEPRKYIEESLKKSLTIMGAKTIAYGRMQGGEWHNNITAVFPDERILVVNFLGKAGEKTGFAKVIETEWSKERNDELELILFKLDQHTDTPIFEPLPEHFNMAGWITK